MIWDSNDRILTKLLLKIIVSVNCLLCLCNNSCGEHVFLISNRNTHAAGASVLRMKVTGRDINNGGGGA